MITVEQALEILDGNCRPLESTEIELAESHGFVLDEAVAADRDFPPTDRSAMDGFAVRAEDAAEPGAILRIAGEVRAGQPPPEAPLARGEALRIFTGAVIPPGADSVVMVERTDETDDRASVRIHVAVSPGQHVRGQGQDLKAGEAVLEPGVPLHAPEIASLASIGHTRARVHRRPHVRVLSTGDEVVEAERQPALHQVRNSNGPTLMAQLDELGFEGRYLGIAGDSTTSLDTLIRRGLRGDVLLITGGVSVGQYDLVERALERAGMELLFHGVAMKPGKPILAGRIGDSLVFGLPGNPLSTYCGFAVFVTPVLRRLAGYRHWRNPVWSARLSAPLSGKPGRATYHLARFSLEAGQLTAGVVPSTGSGDVLSMSRANGFLVTGAEGADLKAGDTAEGLLWKDFALR